MRPCELLRALELLVIQHTLKVEMKCLLICINLIQLPSRVELFKGGDVRLDLPHRVQTGEGRSLLYTDTQRVRLRGAEDRRGDEEKRSLLMPKQRHSQSTDFLQ